MNLYDIVRRSDRTLCVLAGNVQAIRVDGANGYFGAQLTRGTRIRLTDASEFQCLKTFPRDLGWTIYGSDTLTIDVRGISGRTQQLWKSDGKASRSLFNWPAWVAQEEGFHIELSVGNFGDASIASSPIFDTRKALRPSMRGKGVEVGPGANPQILPGHNLDVMYVETMPPDQWIENYAKGTQVLDKHRALWDRYLIGDAQQLQCCEDGSLDFIFSNHVFEHLMNPLGVLQNWSRKLRPGGIIAGVVPDLRYCFDLRQLASTEKDWLCEYESKSWKPSIEKYQRWCQFTEPRSNPESLIARNYSIHMHYYTPETFRTLLELARDKELGTNPFLNTSPNNKDFGFVFSKDVQRL